MFAYSNLISFGQVHFSGGKPEVKHTSIRVSRTVEPKLFAPRRAYRLSRMEDRSMRDGIQRPLNVRDHRDVRDEAMRWISRGQPAHHALQRVILRARGNEPDGVGIRMTDSPTDKKRDDRPQARLHP